MPNRLWTPDGDVEVGPKKATTGISARDMEQIARFADLAQRLKIMLICPRCNASFHGHNAEFGRTHSIACNCREIKAEVRGNILV